MFVAQNFIVSLVGILNIVLWLYMWLIIARALLSWVNPDPYNKVVQFIHRLTEPVLSPLRRILPFRGLGVDLSPLAVLVIIYLLQNFLLKSLVDFSYRWN